MRRCLRCNCEMVEGCKIKVFASNAGIAITHPHKKFFARIGAPKAAICPSCGEISLYLDDREKLDRLSEYTK